MILRTVIRDCLLLSWALPPDCLPALPQPLRYELKDADDGPRVLVTALLFFHDDFRVATLPLPRFSCPQFCLAMPVLDDHRAPSLYFTRVLMPVWLAAAARFVSSPPVATAQLHYDRPSEQPDAGLWHWSVGREGQSLSVCARPGPPLVSSLFSSWEVAVESFRQRRRGYYTTSKGLRSLETRLPSVDAVPLSAQVESVDLLSQCLPQASSEVDAWPELQTAMLFPDLPLEFERSASRQTELGTHRVPQPAPSRRCAL